MIYNFTSLQHSRTNSYKCETSSPQSRFHEGENYNYRQTEEEKRIQFNRIQPIFCLLAVNFGSSSRKIIPTNFKLKGQAGRCELK